MRQPDGGYVVSRDQYDAVLFDLDGVITNTAKLHAACWKQMFDQYLQKRAGERAEAFRPFDLATDYRLYLDVKPRFDGVRDFPASRGIKLPGAQLRRSRPLQWPLWTCDRCRAQGRCRGAKAAWRECGGEPSKRTGRLIKISV